MRTIWNQQAATAQLNEIKETEASCQVFLQLLDQNRRSSTSSIADACQPVLTRLQVVHHVTHNSRTRHPDKGERNKERCFHLL